MMDSLVEYGYESGEEEEILIVSRKETTDQTPRPEENSSLAAAVSALDRADSLSSSNNNHIETVTTRCVTWSSVSVSQPYTNNATTASPQQQSPADFEPGGVIVEPATVGAIPPITSSESLDVPLNDTSAESFLMPEQPKTRPSKGLLDNISRLHKLKSEGVTVTGAIGNSSGFQNPYLLEKIMKIFDIDPYCSNYPRDIYDPKRVVENENEFYDALGRRQTDMTRLKANASSNATKTSMSSSSATTGKPTSVLNNSSFEGGFHSSKDMEVREKRPLASKWDKQL